MKIKQNKSKVMDIYVKDVRSVVEFAAVVWSSSLTKEDIGSIERVQKCALPSYLEQNTEIMKKHVPYCPWRN